MRERRKIETARGQEEVLKAEVWAAVKSREFADI